MEAPERRLDQVLDHLPALEAAIHIVAQIDEVTVDERPLGIGDDPSPITLRRSRRPWMSPTT